MLTSRGSTRSSARPRHVHVPCEAPVTKSAQLMRLGTCNPNFIWPQTHRSRGPVSAARDPSLLITRCTCERVLLPEFWRDQLICSSCEHLFCTVGEFVYEITRDSLTARKNGRWKPDSIPSRHFSAGRTITFTSGEGGCSTVCMASATKQKCRAFRSAHHTNNKGGVQFTSLGRKRPIPSSPNSNPSHWWVAVGRTRLAKMRFICNNPL